MNNFTETEHTSYGSHIGNSFKGIIFGLILLLVSIILLWWNEGRSVDQATALKEMQEKIITLPNTKYEQKYNQQPILIQGNVTPVTEITDTLFGVVSNGLILHRHAEMYQWKEQTSSETTENVGGSSDTKTTYDYKKEWSSYAINSSSFKYPESHQNPPMNYKSENYSSDANIGDFYLAKNIVQNFGNSQPFNGLSSMPKKVGEAKNHKQFLYIGDNPQEPKIGDIKISYQETPTGVYSIAGKAQDKSLVEYQTSNGKSFVFIRAGKVSAEQIFQEELDANTTLTWILRVAGLLVMFIGFSLLMAPLSTLANVIPMLGSLVEGATGIVAGLLTLLLGSIIIALAWFTSRPLLSLAIISVGIALSFGLSKLKGGKSSTTSQPTRRTPPSRR